MKIIFIYLFMICYLLTSCEPEIKSSEQCLGEWKMINDYSHEKSFILKENGTAIYNNLTLRDFDVNASIQEDIPIPKNGSWEFVSYHNSDSDNLLIKLLKNIFDHQYLHFKFPMDNVGENNQQEYEALLIKWDELEVWFPCPGDPDYFGCIRFRLVSPPDRSPSGTPTAGI